MNAKKLIAPMCIAAIGAAAVVTSIALAEPGKDPKHAGAPAGMPEMKLPAGWTTEDMQACMVAGTPGKMHQELAKRCGTWTGKCTMWMAPNTEPMKSECTAVLSNYMDGRFVKCDVNGEMPGMGPFMGFGLNGYDNVTKKFVGTWVDNMGTGMMTGTGEMSADMKTITWNYSMSCPIAKKAVAVRQVEKMTGDNTMTMEMWGPDPKTGKEFKNMTIEYTRK